MRSKLIYFIWLVAFVGVMVCVLASNDAAAQHPAFHALAETPSAAAPTPKSTEGMPYRGVAMQIQRVDWMDKYKQSIDDIAAIGADTVSLVLDTRMENGKSNRIWLDMRMTPNPDQLGSLIDHAKKKGLRVMLVPIVLLDNPKGNEWRGTISPEDWDEWWESYRAMILHFAWIAQSHKADILSIGSELVSTEEKVSEWTRTIDEVRQVFSGKLTYSANWDKYDSIPFWNRLDFVGMNSYWKLGKDHHATVAEIKKNWAEIQSSLIKFREKVNKPILFTEVGWCSLANAAHEPWDYTRTNEDLDLDLQKRLYQGFFESWYGNPNLGGFMMWEWPADQAGRENKGYTPKGKPAEAILRDYFAKPRWQVK